MARFFNGSAFRCDKIVVIVTLLEAIEDIPDKDCNFLGNDKFNVSMSRFFNGSAFRCDKIVVIVTLLEAIEDIPDKDCNFLGNDKFQETTS